MKRRIFSLLLALLLLLGTWPGAALASDAPDEEDPVLAGEGVELNTKTTPDEDAGLEVFYTDSEDDPLSEPDEAEEAAPRDGIV